MLEHINQELDMDLKIPAKDVNLSKKILGNCGWDKF